MHNNPYQPPQAVTYDRPSPLPAGWWRATIATMLFLGYGLPRDWDFVVPAVLILAVLGLGALVGLPQETALPKPTISLPERLSNAAFLVATACVIALMVAMLNGPDLTQHQPPLVYIRNTMWALFAIGVSLPLVSK